MCKHDWSKFQKITWQARSGTLQCRRERQGMALVHKYKSKDNQSMFTTTNNNAMGILLPGMWFAENLGKFLNINDRVQRNSEKINI
jgi:hypothetical protein